MVKTTTPEPVFLQSTGIEKMHTFSVHVRALITATKKAHANEGFFKSGPILGYISVEIPSSDILTRIMTLK